MKRNIQALFTVSTLAVGSVLNSCDSMIFDDQGDCSVHYRVPFTYTRNVLDADAFVSQVNSVTLYVYNQEGKLVLQKTESGETIKAPDYAMDVDLTPGKYSMMVWAQGSPNYTPATSFTIGDATQMSGLSATLPLSGIDGNLYINQEIVPLFHGYSASVDLPDTYGTVTLPAIDLTKDTNTFVIALENYEGLPIAEDALSISIESQSNVLSWQNIPTGDNPFTYRAWSQTLIGSEREQSRADDDTGNVTGLLAELTTSRLMADSRPMLVVHRQYDNTDIIRLDLINLLMLVRGHYPWGGQEYLDRVDRYTMTFFVDADLNWYTAAGINILGWKVVPPQNMEL
ncbi:MAG: FimB/Mfa2 family fimbrial subunit [Muribaculaceae bacterium]|nr:FimB/Mfa2 family fimbrial subunit [Muribaculaceae bacterium]